MPFVQVEVANQVADQVTRPWTSTQTQRKGRPTDYRVADSHRPGARRRNATMSAIDPALLGGSDAGPPARAPTTLHSINDAEDAVMEDVVGQDHEGAGENGGEGGASEDDDDEGESTGRKPEDSSEEEEDDSEEERKVREGAPPSCALR